MAVLVKRAEAFMPLYMESKSLRDPLNGQVAKLLQFEFIHSYCGSKFFTLHYSLFTSKVFVGLGV